METPPFPEIARKNTLEKVQQIKNTVRDRAVRVAELGGWPSYISSDSLLERIPEEGKIAPGFDAGIATALNLIPEAHQKLSATLHANYSPEAVGQVQRETQNFNADTDTTWWLAASSLCAEHTGVNQETFLQQLAQFDVLVKDSGARVDAARKGFEQIMESFSTAEYGFPYGTADGCIQGAYVAGYTYGTMYSEKYDLYFIGTYKPSLGLEFFPWSDEVDEKKNKKSGPVHGSLQFVKCATKEEFLKAMQLVQQTLPQKENIG